MHILYSVTEFPKILIWFPRVSFQEEQDTEWILLNDRDEDEDNDDDNLLDDEVRSGVDAINKF